MFSRYLAGFGACLLISHSMTSLADGAPVIDSKDWQGSLHQTTLPDGSVLSEYVASTQSINTFGAQLHVSFVPRFSCMPQISVRLSATVASNFAMQESLKFSIDQEDQIFPVLVDAHDSLVRYSLNADSSTHQVIRDKLDFASEATVVWGPDLPPRNEGASTESLGEARGAIAADYSLLGSRKAVAMQENRCKSHEPIAYNN